MKPSEMESIPRARDVRGVSERYSGKVAGRTNFPLRKAMDVACSSISRASSRGLTSTVVDVPTFVFGFPLFDVNVVTSAVKDGLEARGFRVLTLEDSPSIAIDWTSDVVGGGSPLTSRERSVAERAVHDSAYDIGL